MLFKHLKMKTFLVLTKWLKLRVCLFYHDHNIIAIQSSICIQRNCILFFPVTQWYLLFPIIITRIFSSKLVLVCLSLYWDRHHSSTNYVQRMDTVHLEKIWFCNTPMITDEMKLLRLEEGTRVYYSKHIFKVIKQIKF